VDTLLESGQHANFLAPDSRAGLRSAFDQFQILTSGVLFLLFTVCHLSFVM